MIALEDDELFNVDTSDLQRRIDTIEGQKSYGYRYSKVELQRLKADLEWVKRKRKESDD